MKSQLVNLEELKKFFIVTKHLQKNLGTIAHMPACPVDVEWHHMLSMKDDYEKFCKDAVGVIVTHVESNGEDLMSWTETYHSMFGEIPEVWFQNTDGILNTVNRERYLRTGEFYSNGKKTCFGDVGGDEKVKKLNIKVA